MLLSFYYFIQSSINGVEFTHLNPFFMSYYNKSKKTFHWIGKRSREKIPEVFTIPI